MLPNKVKKSDNNLSISIFYRDRMLKTGTVFVIAALFCLCCAQLQAQVKEYIYLDGKLLAVEADSQAILCTFTISPSSTNISPGGGTGNISITASNGSCARTATSNAGWITITSGGSGTGSGTVSYSVSANSGSSRSGTITVAEHTFTIYQSACTYSISPTSKSMPAGGGSDSVSVTCSSGCGWTATSNDSWITITSGSSGTGNGTVNYSVAGNTGSERSGTATIAGKTFTVNQAMSAVCGDGICNGTETCQTCVNDCCPWCPSCMAQCMSFPPFNYEYCLQACNCN